MAENNRLPLLLPRPTEASKAKKNSGFPSIKRPTASRQASRLAPQFDRLVHAFETRAAQLRVSPEGIEPELALVFEVIGGSANFFAAVKRIEGLEWLAEYGIGEVAPDDDFYDEEKPDKQISSKVYCVMSDRRALDELLSCWRRYAEDPDYAFDTGYNSLKDVFLSLKEVRVWSARDRFEDTGVIEQWKEDLEVRRGTFIPFEVELFFRSDEHAQQVATEAVRSQIEQVGGRVKRVCVLNEINYHGIAAELPPEMIEDLVHGDLDQIALAKTEQIMFFRPAAQAFSDLSEEDHGGFEGQVVENEPMPAGAPVIAMFDGVPLSNHQLLRDRIVVDDPDDYERQYPVECRRHGTAMASLIIHGDLNDGNRSCLSRPLYARPILKPLFGNKEGFPEGELIVDIIHRAVVRMFDGEGSEQPAAPNVRVINLSVGDSQRQYFNSVSPLARLLDWLSCKYGVLFIISAGNTYDLLKVEGIGCEEFAQAALIDRTKAVVNAVKGANRNLRIFSPSESINAITVGALSSDLEQRAPTEGAFDLVEDGIPSPYSAVGPGVNSAIKPEVFLPGGRLRARGLLDDGHLQYATFEVSGPGCRVARPVASQPMIGEGYTVGTSVSAAILSHASGMLYESFENIFLEAGEPGVPDEFAAVLLKAALVHGASWDQFQRAKQEFYDVNNQHADRWFGYGAPDFSKVVACSDRRVTAIGFGKLKNGHAHEYRLPFPVDLHSRPVRRKITATLAYMSPVAAERREYRRAQLWFTREGETEERLVPNRVNTDWQGVTRGTLQHEIFFGEHAIPWGYGDEIELKVSCRQGTQTGAIGGEVPYAFLVTVEIAEPIADIYAKVSNELCQKVEIASS